MNIFLSTVNFAEIYYNIFRRFGEETTNTILGLFYGFNISIVDADWKLAIAAAKIKSIHPIALGDCFAAGLSKLKNAQLVTGTPEFSALENEVDIIWLPKK